MFAIFRRQACTTNLLSTLWQDYPPHLNQTCQIKYDKYLCAKNQPKSLWEAQSSANTFMLCKPNWVETEVPQLLSLSLFPLCYISDCLAVNLLWLHRVTLLHNICGTHGLFLRIKEQRCVSGKTAKEIKLLIFCRVIMCQECVI